MTRAPERRGAPRAWVPDDPDAPIPVAFHAPMKPPDHPTPSGDRRIARLTLEALTRAGFAPRLASTLRTLEMKGDRARQQALMAEADLEVERLLEDYSKAPPALWFTYHNYWKAPDLVGPKVAAALGIPYVCSEASHSPKRMTGPWAGFAETALDAFRGAAMVYWTTERDRPGLAEAIQGGLSGSRKLRRLPAFTDAGPRPARLGQAGDLRGPLRLLAVAMMRPGDKLASYQALADALSELDDIDWRLSVIGDGEERRRVREMFDECAGRVDFAGRVDDPARLRKAYEASELLVWPGVGEGFGMVYLEAQAAGLPCLAEDRPGPRDVILGPGFGAETALPAPGDPGAFADAIRRAARRREALAARGTAARLFIEQRHSIEAAAAQLRRELRGLIGLPA